MRDDMLEDSILGVGDETGFAKYSQGRVRLLAKLKNPFFVGGNDESWDSFEKMGTAWVVFTRSVEESKTLIESDNPRKAFADIWEEDMHERDHARIYEYLVNEAGLSEAAQTKVVKQPSPGKSGEVQSEPMPTG